ncbi:leucine-rich repeat receptor-like serine/threonine/tyrosine-protein kinase SOBIR1, partial [Tanacetum coccineum]
MTLSGIGGTMGYIAPEYYDTHKLSEKCDIYSFGVLLGVLVTGKFPSDKFFWDIKTEGLAKWMREVLNSDNPRQAIDPLLLDNGYENQMIRALEIACYCTHDNLKYRPDS